MLAEADYAKQVEVHVQVTIPGTRAQTTVLAGEVTEAIDKALNKLHTQLMKYKEKTRDQERHTTLEDITADAADIRDIDPNEAK